MKRVLIIANLFYASPRIPGLAKYLPEFGWQPIILTSPIGTDPDSRFGPPDRFIKSGIRIIETPYRNIFSSWKKFFGFKPDESLRNQVAKQLGVTSKNSFVDFFLNMLRAVFAYPDEEKAWKPLAFNAGNDFLEKEDIDVIISSSSPVTSHIVAKDLKTRHKIPWVADLRDLWSQNHNYSYGPLRKWIDKRLELKTLMLADVLVTVSGPLAEELRALHKEKTIHSITNGFDPEEMNTSTDNLTTKFTITYTGNIYLKNQETSKLLAALRDLISDRTMKSSDVEVRFYGPKYIWLEKEIEEYSLNGVAKQYGVIARQVSFKKQKESQLLLMLNVEDTKERGVYSLKIFEYLAAQRPILATGGTGHDVVKELLDETKAGIYCSTVEDIKNILNQLYSEYKLTGKINYKGDKAKINKYSYRAMAKKFTKILNALR